jgi:hypothetical protein
MPDKQVPGYQGFPQLNDNQEDKKSTKDEGGSRGGSQPQAA